MSPVDCMKDHCYINLKNFSVEIDWDLDWTKDDGCHGTDLFFDDDPVQVDFRYSKDGTVYIKSKDKVSPEYEGDGFYYVDKKYCHYDYKLTPSDKLYRWKKSTTQWIPTNSIPYIVDYNWNQNTFTVPLHKGVYECFLDSANELKPEEKEVVERFFKAIEILYKDQYSPTQ